MKRIGVLIALLLAGCGAAPDRTVLRVWDWWSPAEGEAMTEYFRVVEADFERQHPGVDLRFQYIPFGPQYIQKIMAGTAAGSPPDVLHASVVWANDLYERGILRDLRPFIAKSPDMADEVWLPTARRYGRDGDYVYGLPIEQDASCLVYNLDLFEAAGVPTDPFALTSWDDLRQAAQRMTKRDSQGRVTQAGLMLIGSAIYDYLPWVYANGGQFYSGDLRRAAFNTPNVREALQFVQDMHHKDRVSFPVATDRLDIQYFVQGRVGVFLGGTWMGHMIEEQAPGMRYGMTSLPPGPRGAGRSGMVWTNLMCIPKGAAHPELAWEFLRYYCGLKNAVRKLEIIDRNSPLAGFYETPEWKKAVQQHPSLSMLPHITSVGGPYPTLRTTEVEEILRPQCEGFILRNLTAQQVLDTAEPKVNEVLDLYHRELEEAYR